MASKERLIFGLCLFGFGMINGFVTQRLTHTPPSKAYIVLVIDDFGNHNEGVDEILNLGIPVTVAVMPFLPASRDDAWMAYSTGHDVILHMPMEPMSRAYRSLGPRPITVNLGSGEIKARINQGLDELGCAVGLNSHMGSRATADARVMQAVLEVSQERGLFYIDSRTADSPVTPAICKSLAVPCLKRNVFIDESHDVASIKKRLLFLGEIARKTGCAVGVGHVGPAGGMSTVTALKQTYPVLRGMGIELISASRMIELLSVTKWLSSPSPDYLNDGADYLQ